MVGSQKKSYFVHIYARKEFVHLKDSLRIISAKILLGKWYHVDSLIGDTFW